MYTYSSRPPPPSLSSLTSPPPRTYSFTSSSSNSSSSPSSASSGHHSGTSLSPPSPTHIPSPFNFTPVRPEALLSPQISHLSVHTPETICSDSGYYSLLSPNSVSSRPSSPLTGSVSCDCLQQQEPALPDVSTVLATLKAVSFDFILKIDRIRVSWKETDWHRLDEYQLRAYLLLDETDERETRLEHQQTQEKQNEESSNKKSSKKATSTNTTRKLDQKHLATLTATRTLTLTTTGDTEICFDGSQIPFRTRITVESKRKHSRVPSLLPGKNTDASSRAFVFRSRVVRLKLERIKHGVTGHTSPIGFVDLDLAQLRQCCPEGGQGSPQGLTRLPMVLFSDYSRHIGRHEGAGGHPGTQSVFTGRGPRPFTFDIRLKLDSTPLAIQDLPSALSANLDQWISAESLMTSVPKGGQGQQQQLQHLPEEEASLGAMADSVPSMTSTSSSSSSQSLYLSQLLLRRDSLPNLSLDRELKYHDTPPTSRTQHLLNLLGLLPPGQLFRVSIHFGAIEQFDSILALADSSWSTSASSCIPKSRSADSRASVYATFEVKHHQHQPTIFHQHHQRSSITARTRPLTSSSKAQEDDGFFFGPDTENNRNDDDSPSFDQTFIFFERFHYRDSPPTSLSLRCSRTGKKLFRYKCHLAEYVHARSVNQYFGLASKKTGQMARLQFSIAVKPVHQA